MSDDFINEVNEGLARDQWTARWKAAQPWIFGGIAAILAGVGGFEAWKWWKADTIDAAAVKFHAAVSSLEAGKPADAIPVLKELAGGGSGFGVLAGNLLAEAEKANGGDPATIAAAFDTVADEKGVFAELAALKAAYALADTATLADLDARLKPVIAKGGGVSALARELLAAKALDSGDIERARADYQALSLDLDAPQQLQNRARQALLTLPKVAAAAAVPSAGPVTDEKAQASE